MSKKSLTTQIVVMPAAELKTMISEMLDAKLAAIQPTAPTAPLPEMVTRQQAADYLEVSVMTKDIPRIVRCEAAFVVPGAANQQLVSKVMYKTQQRKV